MFAVVFCAGTIRGRRERSIDLGTEPCPKLVKITAANIVTSIIFVVMHMLNTSLIWSLTIFMPSLLYGFFRDTFKSVYPAMVLHSIYNLIVVLGLVIYR